MKRDHTRLLRNFSLLILFCCCSLLTRAICVVSAQWSYTNPARDSAVFTAADTNALVSHVWVFGDGTIDSVSGTLASHVYANAGTYQVCQYVRFGIGGCTDTLCQSITINDTCHITAAWTSALLGG